MREQPSEQSQPAALSSVHMRRLLIALTVSLTLPVSSDSQSTRPARDTALDTALRAQQEEVDAWIDAMERTNEPAYVVRQLIQRLREHREVAPPQIMQKQHRLQAWAHEQCSTGTTPSTAAMQEIEHHITALRTIHHTELNTLRSLIGRHESTFTEQRSAIVDDTVGKHDDAATLAVRIATLEELIKSLGCDYSNRVEITAHTNQNIDETERALSGFSTETAAALAAMHEFRIQLALHREYARLRYRHHTASTHLDRARRMSDTAEHAVHAQEAAR